MRSSCYIIYDESLSTCIIIDPGSEKCEKILSFLKPIGIRPEYIILTHEHTDHTWGCNFLREHYPVSLLCSRACYKNLNSTSKSYFLFYYDNKNYDYVIQAPDVFIEDLNFELYWNTYKISFLATPGHTEGSICVFTENILFTGDTLMETKPVISKRGGNKDDYNRSIHRIFSSFSPQTRIFPGHGRPFYLKDVRYADYRI